MDSKYFSNIKLLAKRANVKNLNFNQTFKKNYEHHRLIRVTELSYNTLSSEIKSLFEENGKS